MIVLLIAKNHFIKISLHCHYAVIYSNIAPPQHSILFYFICVFFFYFFIFLFVVFPSLLISCNNIPSCMHMMSIVEKLYAIGKQYDCKSEAAGEKRRRRRRRVDACNNRKVGVRRMEKWIVSWAQKPYTSPFSTDNHSSAVLSTIFIWWRQQQQQNVYTYCCKGNAGKK